MGNKAVELLIANKSGRALGIKCNEIIDISIDEVFSIEKEFDINMYNMTKILSI